MDCSYKGTHGTTWSAADTIKASGFNSGVGIRGTGVYFWSYRLEALLEEAERLAVAWYNVELRRHRYNSHAEKNCAVILADLNTSENGVFDFERQRQPFMAYALEIQKKLESDKDLSDDERKNYYSALYDRFVEHWEEKAKSSFDAVLVRVPTPPRYTSPLGIDVASQPECIVVRNSNIIGITSIKKLNV
ncbi:hypothetical protein Q5V23_003179 [Vibrio fluvialis]|nr:hypothetical protein [Vibrio fluvialis]